MFRPIYFSLLLACLYLCTSLSGQESLYKFEPSPSHPFGQPHPDAPEQIKDWAPLIGESKCTSVSRANGQDWGPEVDMTWRFKYIMNGWAVQDETLKADGTYAGSIRQYIADSSKWYVHYYSTPGPTTVLPAWEGEKKDDGRIILYRDQTAPNGMSGNYKINFYDITDTGFKWLGEWVTKSESFSYPTWKIECTKKSASP